MALWGLSNRCGGKQREHAPFPGEDRICWNICRQRTEPTHTSPLSFKTQDSTMTFLYHLNLSVPFSHFHRPPMRQTLENGKMMSVHTRRGIGVVAPKVVGTNSKIAQHKKPAPHRKKIKEILLVGIALRTFPIKLWREVFFTCLINSSLMPARKNTLYPGNFLNTYRIKEPFLHAITRSCDTVIPFHGSGGETKFEMKQAVQHTGR